MSEKIQAVVIIEIMGRPADYIKETLSKLVDTIGQNKGFKVLSKKVNEPKPIESELFSTFAELEIEFDNFNNLILMIFTYLPSHIEIIKPDRLAVTNFDLNGLCNDIVRRLHHYDNLAKTAIMERNILESQLKQRGLEPATIKLEEDIKKRIEQNKTQKKTKSGRKTAKKKLRSG